MIQTSRLLFRPWAETDAEALFKHASDPDVGPRAGWPPHKSVEESRSGAPRQTDGRCEAQQRRSGWYTCRLVGAGKMTKLAAEKSKFEVFMNISPKNRIFYGSLFAVMAVLWLILILLDTDSVVLKILGFSACVVIATGHFVSYYREKKNSNK